MIRKLNRIHGPVCGVFAATLTTPDMPFVVVKNMASEEMRKRRWRGAMHLPALQALLTRLGVTFRTVRAEAATLLDAARVLDESKHYIVFVTGHFMTLHNNVGYDQSHPDGVPIEKFWTAGRRIISILEIDRSNAYTYDELFAEGAV